MKKNYLVFTPQFSPSRPPLGIASLKAFLRGEGIEISQIDANVGFYRWIINKYLRSDQYVANITAAIQRNLIQKNNSTSHAEKHWVKALSVADEWRKGGFNLSSLIPSGKSIPIEQIYSD